MSNQQIKDIPMAYITQEDYEFDGTKEYNSLEELEIGMRIHTGQIRNICNTWILIANPIDVLIDDSQCEFVDTLVYVGERNKNFERAYNKYTVGDIRPLIIYNPQEYVSEDMLHYTIRKI